VWVVAARHIGAGEHDGLVTAVALAEAQKTLIVSAGPSRRRHVGAWI
jgi:hypothetical protein